MELMPDEHSAKQRKQKKKVRRKMQISCTWTGAELEAESLEAQTDHSDITTLSLNKDQIQDVFRKKKKKKKKEKEQIKTEDYGEGVASTDTEMVCDASGVELKGADCPKKKRRKKRRAVIEVYTRNHELQSVVTEDGERLDSREELQDRERGQLSPSQGEDRYHKRKRKKKRRTSEQFPPEITTEEEPLSEAYTDEKTADDRKHRERKRTSKESLHRLSKGEIDGDLTTQTTMEKMADDGVKHKKRKRKAKIDLDELLGEGSHEELKSDQNTEITQSISVSESDGVVITKEKKKKKKKTKHLVVAAETTDISEFWVSSCNTDTKGSLMDRTFQEKTADVEARHKKKKRKTQNHQSESRYKKSEEETRDVEEKEQNQGISISESGGLVIPKKRKKKKENNLVDAAETTDFSEAHVLANNIQEGLLLDQASKTSLEETVDGEAGHKKRKRKAREGLNESHYEKSEVGIKHAQDEKQPQNLSIPESSDLVTRKKKKKKKKKYLVDAVEATDFPESQVPSSNVDVQENLSLEDASKTKRRKKKLARSDSGDHGANSTQPNQAETEGQERNNNLKRKHSGTLTGKSSSSSRKRGSSSKGEALDPEMTDTEDKNYGNADGLLGKSQPDVEIEESDEEWMRDLPFYLKGGNFTNAKPKEGVVLKKGRWNGLEDNILIKNVSNFCKQHGITDLRKAARPHLYEDRRQIGTLLLVNKFHMRICKGIMRMPYDVYNRARKILDDRNYKGIFTKEEASDIKRLHKEYGNKWSRIGEEIDRSGQSVLDWHRKLKEGKVNGRWTNEEREQLKRAVMAVTKVEDEDTLHHLRGIPWREVHKLVPTRNLNQCVEQWKFTVCWNVGNRREHMWTSANSVEFIESLYNLDINEESDIDWSELYKEFQDRCPSIGKLAYIWHVLKLRHIPNYRFLTFEHILDVLHNKIVPGLREHAEKKEAREALVKSKEFISDIEDSSDSDTEWF